VKPGTVRVEASVDDTTLRLTVSDDGRGAHMADVDRGGVGLNAVRQRLRARFGDAATLTVTTAPGEGFSVTVTCPAIVGAPMAAAAAR
jgi:signal transduction histidine kinase